MTKPVDWFGLLTGLNRSTIKPVKLAGFGSTVFKTLGVIDGVTLP
jgi:hypothetical protein